jgi:hypothetical protein
MQTNYCKKIKLFFNKLFFGKHALAPKKYEEYELEGSGFTSLPTYLSSKYKKEEQ